GWFGPGQMVKEFEESVKKQSSGSISRVVRTKFGLHIIKKTGQR
ncbi:MAG: peptidylprolyl isomerase, partial [Candidatus Aminicenantes bacterium]|nr:peptidylprolyl isomerase [Candidatus Aminicenantes bacterium]